MSCESDFSKYIAYYQLKSADPDVPSLLLSVASPHSSLPTSPSCLEVSSILLAFAVFSKGRRGSVIRRCENRLQTRSVSCSAFAASVGLRCVALSGEIEAGREQTEIPSRMEKTLARCENRVSLSSNGDCDCDLSMHYYTSLYRYRYTLHLSEHNSR